MEIITHRGLNPSRKNYFPESTWEAFADQLSRGYGLEFDVQLTLDKELVIFHSPDLSAISGGSDKRKLAGLSAAEIKELRFAGCRLCFLEELIAAIMASQAPLSALHLKGQYQTDEVLEILSRQLAGFDPTRFIIFDVKIATARKLKAKNSAWQLAPSVAHSYDIKRYNQAVHGTLYSLDEVAANRDIFDWVWLDEWDRSDASGKKIFYSPDVFAFCRRNGFKIGLVTPELHATSPGLLGGEAHPDAATREKLFRRISEILAFGPDLVCTDYPDEVKKLTTC
ncbi:MAG: glycerophosphodiester phosphodiesterase family protein [Patescibacteria group bacterium]|nr:glycerophosphodiester phosphodiesterase family protein [Patescibacteria group bacterium]